MILPFIVYLVSFPEIFFFCAAFRTNPPFREFFPGSTRLNPILIIPFFRIVYIATRAFPFLHNTPLLEYMFFHPTLLFTANRVSVKGLFGLPYFPDLANQINTRFERCLTRAPS